MGFLKPRLIGCIFQGCRSHRPGRSDLVLVFLKVFIFFTEGSLSDLRLGTRLPANCYSFDHFVAGQYQIAYTNHAPVLLFFS